MGGKIKKTVRSIIIALIVLTNIIIPAGAEQINSNMRAGWKTVRVSCGINKSLYINENGEPEGYCCEYINQLAKINHWNIQYVEGSWSESVQNLYDNKIDILFPTQMTEDRKGKMGFSNAIGGYQPIGLFAKKDSDYCFDDYKKFDGARIALSTGTSNEAALNAYAAENNFTYTAVNLNTTEEKMQALADGTVDMIVFSTLNDVENGKVVAMLDYLPFYYCTNINNTELLKELDYGMNQMLLRNPVMVQNVFYDFMNKNISFAYTADEKAAIESKGKLVVGIYDDTPPLFNTNNDGSYSGIYVDLIEKIQSLSGLNIEIKPLDRSIYPFDYLDEGKLDFVLGSSDQALKYVNSKGYVMSDGIMDYYTITITKNNYLLSKDKKTTFALTKGRKFWESEILKQYSKAEFKYYNSTKDCLDAILDGKADASLVNTWEYNYQSKNDRFQQLIDWETSRTLSETVFISLDSENELIRSVLDKAIEQISNPEKESIITANLNESYKDYNLKDRLYSMKQGFIVFGFVILIMIVALVVYIAMRKKNIKALKDKNQQLEIANDSKTKFLARMSHELRTPLNAITGYASALKEKVQTHSIDDKTAEMNLNSILMASQYQLAIVGDLLDIQKIESGKLDIVKTEVDSDKYMNNIVEMIKPEADSKNINFQYERLSRVSETYILDGVRFQQILINILHNAIKFTPEGGNVKMTAEVIDKDEKNNTLKFVIADDGIGMSEDFQKNYLFHKFAQEYQGNTSPYEGCGTGLAISRELIHLMGGEITCKSEKDKGSTFTVIITAEHIEKKRKRRRKSEVPSYDLGEIRILLCEDNKMNQDIEKGMLERMKCVVEIADDGQIGLNKFSVSEPGYYDVILMDIRMPNMDGWETTEKIRSLEREDAKKIPIIAVSANAFDEDIKHSLESGMNEHLAKPVNPRLMNEVLTKYTAQQ